MIIILGNIVSVLYGPKTNQTYSLEQLYELLLQPTFLIYYLILAITVIILQSLYLFLEYHYIPKHGTSAILKR